MARLETLELTYSVGGSGSLLGHSLGKVTVEGPPSWGHGTFAYNYVLGAKTCQMLASFRCILAPVSGATMVALPGPHSIVASQYNVGRVPVGMQGLWGILICVSW